MSFTDSMTPRLQQLRKRLPAAIEAINRGNARAILDFSQPIVPVDTGSLKRSGRVVAGPRGSSILIYGGAPFTNSRTGKIIDYAYTVHYFHRTQSQFVGWPLRTERLALMKAASRAMRKWLKGR